MPSKSLSLAGGLALAVLGGQLLAQQSSKQLTGPTATFTADQSSRGKALYNANCLSCHGADAAGGQFAPALKGTAFDANWAARLPRDLFTFIRETMPPGQMGSLPAADYEAITAYLLEANGARAGTKAFMTAESGSAPAATTARPPEPGRNTAIVRAAVNEDEIFKKEIARQSAITGGIRSVTEEMLRNPPEGDWLMWRRSYSGLGFSPLKQINRTNAKDLRLAWGLTLSQSLNEITPLVHDGVLFIHSGAMVRAVDAQDGTPLWEYTRTLPDSLNGGRTGRSKGMAIYQNTLFLPMVDGHMVALDAKTGKVLWDHEVLSKEDVSRGVQLNGVPIVAKGKVMMGTTLSITLKGGCYIFALDTATGEEKWRFHTVAQPGEVGGESWNGVPGDQRFGGSQWTGGSYDPDLGLIYFGVGNTYSTATLIRPDEGPMSTNAGLFTESTIALDPETGKLAWHFQHMPRDLWDMDWAFEQLLVDMPVNGKLRKMVVSGGKMALFDAVDRADGSYVLSRDAGLQDIVTAIDPKTGAKTYNPALTPVSGEQKLICPGSSGFRNWMSTAYDPVNHYLYVPIFENCGNFTWTKRDATAVAAGGMDQRFQTRKMPDSDGNFGRIQAIDMRTGRTAWMKRQRAPISSSMLATAGGLLLSGSGDRYFRAFDQRTGKLLWQTRLASTASSSPITYSVNGVQYIAVVTGGGNPQDAGWASLAPEIRNPSGSTALWIFRLGSAEMN
ncbi:PQQ-binding-like beta-propeller repeat protein [Sphingobium sp. H39-3-25]|uniref:outer membrane protein assembly factor BamB family protein n=1 Tax=Sphingobium arseniciresistens TaxID=3030834 RepID=UPI0023B9B5F7|nr:PQQ-binding-like beta-propeller repeat protein [Sphingobium arseniciresistens]